MGLKLASVKQALSGSKVLNVIFDQNVVLVNRED
jgi:hypothetical protein